MCEKCNDSGRVACKINAIGLGRECNPHHLRCPEGADLSNCTIPCDCAKPSVVDTLRARVKELEGEVSRVRDLINRDRTGLAKAMSVVRDTISSYGWIARAEWGNYSYEDQTVETLQREFGDLWDRINEAVRTALRGSGNLATSAFHPEVDGHADESEGDDEGEVWRKLYFSQMVLISDAERVIVGLVRKDRRSWWAIEKLWGAIEDDMFHPVTKAVKTKDLDTLCKELKERCRPTIVEEAP